MSRTPFATTALVLSLVATPLAANPPLKDVAEIRDGIVAVGIAYEISEVCDSISARLIRGLTFLNGLKSRARELGYSDDEIEAYIDDDGEKKRLEGIARAQLMAWGASPGDEASHCAVGENQIAAGSAVGRLLR